MTERINEESHSPRRRPRSMHAEPNYLMREFYAPILKELEKTKRSPGVGEFGQPNLKDLVTYADEHSEGKTTIYILKGPPRVGKSYRLALTNGFVGLRNNTLVTDWENAIVETLGYMPRKLLTSEQRDETNHTLESNVVKLMRRRHQKPKNVILEVPGTAFPLKRGEEVTWVGNNRGDELVRQLVTHDHPLIPEPYNVAIAAVTSGGALHEIASLTRILKEGIIPLGDELQHYIKLSQLPIPKTADNLIGSEPRSASSEQMRGIDHEIDEEINIAKQHGILKEYSEEELKNFAQQARVFEDAQELGIPPERMLDHFVKHLYLAELDKFTFEQFGITSDSPWAFIGLSNPRPYELSNYDLRHLTAIKWLLDRSSALQK